MTNLAKNNKTDNKTLQIKTIDIEAKEWFDKVNGNSYFAGIITVDFGMPTEKQFKMPYQYGYGDCYRSEAIKTLKENNYLPKDFSYSYFQDNGIIIRSSIQKNCKKSELKNI